MKRAGDAFVRLAEAVAAAMMALMFATFILQVAIRYTARVDGVTEAVPILHPANFGWTLEFCLALWVWLVFWGNAFIVRNRDHVSFDILYLGVSASQRRRFYILTALVIAGGLLLSIGPTWERIDILRLRRSATLSAIFGDWIRMRDVYAIYLLFLVVVVARYAFGIWHAFRHGVEEPVLSTGERVEP